eukprot:536848-Pleurochrysis_carterae.AAC.1
MCGCERAGPASRVVEGEPRKKVGNAQRDRRGVACAAEGHGGAPARGALDNRLRDEGSADTEGIAY